MPPIRRSLLVSGPGARAALGVVLASAVTALLLGTASAPAAAGPAGLTGPALTGPAGLMGLALAGPALNGPVSAAPAGGLGLAVVSDEAGRPAVELTNGSAAPCRVAATALGTVSLVHVVQDGVDVAPDPLMPAFDDDPAYTVASGLRLLGPGERVRLPLDLVDLGPDRPALRTVSFAGPTVIGSAYPVATGRPLTVQARYHLPVAPGAGAPACADVEGSGIVAPGVAVAASRWWPLVAVAVVVLILAATAVVLLRRRRRGPTAVAAAIVLCGLSGGLVAITPAAPARATLAIDHGIDEAVQACLTSFRQPGHDPGGILAALDAPGHTIAVRPTEHNNGEYRVAIDPQSIFVYWDPDDRRPFQDGVARDPCDELYHELYHASEDTTPEGADPHACYLEDGTYTGIAIREVHSVRAENALRRVEHHAERTVYGAQPLPTGDCRPSRPTDITCHPQRGCPASPTPPTPPAPPPPPPARPVAVTTSDPHLTTFDGRRFDFQAKGEFVAVRAPDGPQLQVRQEGFFSDRYVAVTTAVAADVHGDRVEVRLAGTGVVLLVNGTVRPVTDIRLPHGGAVVVTAQPTGDMVTLDWPDQTYANIVTYHGVALTLVVWTPPRYAGHLTGLLGDRDGQPGNDVPAAGGPATRPTYDDLYPSYADSLRITPGQSLFTYAAGTSTATYTDRTFPDREPPPGPRTAWARVVCEGYGLTDPVTLDNCVVDLAHTGSADLLVAAADAEPVGLAASSDVDTAPVHLAVTSPGATASTRFTGRAGEVVFVDAPTADVVDQCGDLVLTDAAGHSLGSGCTNGSGGYVDRTVLPADATYTVTFDPGGPATGSVDVRVIEVHDQTGTLTLDGAAVATRVAQPGGVVRLTFDAPSGSGVFVDASPAGLPDQCGALILRDPAGHVVATGCVGAGAGFIDATRLAAAGTYTVEVDPAGRATGAVRLRVNHVTDQDSPITVGGPAVTATVAQPGTVARLRFTATAGQRVTVEATGVTLPDQCGTVTLRGPDQSVLGSACTHAGTATIATTALSVGGSYTVLVDPAGAATGAVTIRIAPQ